MTFHSVLLQPSEEQTVRGWNGPLPFYMTHSLYPGSNPEDKVMRDLEYLQQMYPADVKHYQKRIASLLDNMDYEGSMIYDEYPDRCSLRALAASILKILQNEEENSPAEDMIQVLLFHEIYKRRCGGQRRQYRIFS